MFGQSNGKSYSNWAISSKLDEAQNESSTEIIVYLCELVRRILACATLLVVVFVISSSLCSLIIAGRMPLTDIISVHLEEKKFANKAFLIVPSPIAASSTVNGGTSGTLSISVASSTYSGQAYCPAQSFNTVQNANYTYEIECRFLNTI